MKAFNLCERKKGKILKSIPLGNANLNIKVVQSDTDAQRVDRVPFILALSLPEQNILH